MFRKMPQKPPPKVENNGFMTLLFILVVALSICGIIESISRPGAEESSSGYIDCYVPETDSRVRC